MIKVREQDLHIDILEELAPFEWYRGRVRIDEFTACSPFREDGSPSFSINLSTGKWIDFGAGEESGYHKGSLITLLSFLRQETPQEIESYLLDKYGVDFSDVDKLELGLDFTFEEETPFSMPLEEYEKYSYRHSYLSGRGISDKVQNAFKVGYDKDRKAVALAWQDIKGNIVNVKFRSVSSKMFFYLPDGQPLRNHIYGMHFIYKMNCKKVYVCESEIDCLYLWSHGYPAIALGGSNLSKIQRQLILRSPITDLIIATDNDKAGQKIKGKIVENVNGLLNIHEIGLPEGVKDVNDLSPKILQSTLENYTQVPIFSF